MIKTENLVILFTDIAGFTEATSLHSREQNQRILERHNSILLPIVKRFHGRHIKSIGDALLLVFTSPTDGMRCAMAMQDALHAYNLTAPQNEQIHIRIAASLGEVRVSRGDIFGEPVNVTSRIEGVTPADEIYFSEAVYLAMNKAEVPAIEIGVHELKGITKPVRLYAIPRFANSRLVPEETPVEQHDPHLSFPFGGMHLSAAPVAETWTSRLQKTSAGGFSSKRYISLGAAAVAALGFILFFVVQRENPVTAKEASAVGAHDAPLPAAAPPPVASPQGAPPPQLASSDRPPEVNSAAVAVAQQTPPPASTPVAAVAPKKPGITNILQAKRAYRDARISKERYREIVRRLEDDLDLQIRRAKLDYKDGRISKETYRRRVESLKRTYEGE